MKKQIAITIAAAALMLAAPAKQTFTGVITDDMCANADHKAMKWARTPSASPNA